MEMETGTNMVSKQSKIKIGEKLAYSCGGFANTILFGAMSTFLLFFYTDVAKIDAALVGTIMLISRVLDGFIDISVGAIVDKTKSKQGKARPWFLRICIPYAISGILLFTIPDFGNIGNIIYIFLTYNFANICYSFLNIPFSVLNSTMTQDPGERAALGMFGAFAGVPSTLLVSMGTMPLVQALGGGPRAWQTVFLLLGILSIILYSIIYKFTKERINSGVDGNGHSESVPFKVGLASLFKNKYWLMVIGEQILIQIVVAVSIGINIYYSQYIFHDANLTGLLSLASFVPMMLGIFATAPFVKKYGKRNLALAGGVVCLIGSALMIINSTALPIILAGLVIRGVGAGMIGCLFNPLLADTTEYGEWKTGVKCEGLAFSAYSFANKAGGGLGSSALGWLLAIGGYVGGAATQSEGAMTAIKAGQIYIPIVCFGLVVIIFSFYKLDKEYPMIIEELKKRKAANA